MPWQLLKCKGCHIVFEIVAYFRKEINTERNTVSLQTTTCDILSEEDSFNNVQPFIHT